MEEFWGKGFGELLLNNLIAKSEQEGYWTLQAGIFPENKSSLRLHQKLGFQVVGIRDMARCCVNGTQEHCSWDSMSLINCQDTDNSVRSVKGYSMDSKLIHHN